MTKVHYASRGRPREQAAAMRESGALRGLLCSSQSPAQQFPWHRLTPGARFTAMVHNLWNASQRPMPNSNLQGPSDVCTKRSKKCPHQKTFSACPSIRRGHHGILARLLLYGLSRVRDVSCLTLKLVIHFFRVMSFCVRALHSAIVS